MTLKNKNVTHISCLKKGDRFYLANDKNKIVWQVDYHTSFWFKEQQKKATWCATDAGEFKRFISNRVIIHLTNGKSKLTPGMVYKAGAGFFGYERRPKELFRPTKRLPSAGIEIKRSKSRPASELFYY